MCDPIERKNPTHQGVHIIQPSNLPKKPGLYTSAVFLKPSKIDPNTIMLDIEYPTKIINNNSIIVTFLNDFIIFIYKR